MCGLFGFLRYGEAIKNLSTLINSLAEQSAIRGTDATGIAFNEGGKLKIIKDGKSAYELDIIAVLEIKLISRLTVFDYLEFSTFVKSYSRGICAPDSRLLCE